MTATNIRVGIDMPPIRELCALIHLKAELHQRSPSYATASCHAGRRPRLDPPSRVTSASAVGVGPPLERVERG